MTDVSDLIRRLEEAEKPSPDLDRAIMPFAGYVLEKRGRDRNAWWYPVDERRGRKSNTAGPFPSDLPPFTRSLDTAMTLIPEGWAWNLHDNGQCTVWDDPDAITTEAEGHGATPALGACIAALKARKADNG